MQGTAIKSGSLVLFQYRKKYISSSHHVTQPKIFAFGYQKHTPLSI